jgi:hypothetical protein
MLMSNYKRRKTILREPWFVLDRDRKGWNVTESKLFVLMLFYFYEVFDRTAVKDGKEEALKVERYFVPWGVVTDFLGTNIDKNRSRILGYIEHLCDTKIRWALSTEIPMDDDDIESMRDLFPVDLGKLNGEEIRSRCGYTQCFCAPELIETDNGRYLSFGVPDLARHILQFRSIYARITINVVKCLESKHGVALYELCRKAVRDTGKSYNGQRSTGWITIDDFRERMGVPKSKSYGSFGLLNLHVIKKALSEVNKPYSDIKVEVEYSRVDPSTGKLGKSVKMLRFWVKDVVPDILTEVKFPSYDMEDLDPGKDDTQDPIADDLAGEAESCLQSKKESEETCHVDYLDAHPGSKCYYCPRFDSIDEVEDDPPF